MPAKLLKGVKRFDLTAMVPYDPRYLAGVQAQAYDIDLEEAWGLGRSHMRALMKRGCVATISSSQMRNFSMTLDFGGEGWRYVLFPVYMAAYVYGGRWYQVMINGQSGVLAGQRPVDWRKVLGAIGLCFVPAMLVLVVAAVTEVGLLVLLGFVLLVAAVVGSVLIGIEANG